MVDQVVKRTLLRSPMAWIVLAIGVLHAVGLNWGLPNIDGWDDDGVAPRDFLVGLSQTYTPGQYYTYPPVHLLILAVVTSPITLVTLGKASSFAPDELVRTFLNPWTMTWFALLARVVTWAMSLGIVLALGQLAERVWGRIAGLATAVAVGLNATFCYYAHTSNLDVPYCFWACCSLLQWVRAMADHEPRRMRWAAVFAALAVGTKDQAYALFLLGIPLALALWMWTDGWARKQSRQVFREVGLSLLIGAVSLLVLDGAVFNPTGFRARIAFLLGTASQDHAYYSKDAMGRWRLLVDSVLAFDRYYPWPVGGLVLGGLGAHLFRSRGSKLAAGLLPCLAALSFLVAFNVAARRTEHRFLLPQSLLIAVYVGTAVQGLMGVGKRAQRWVVGGGLGAIGLLALYRAVAVDVALVFDPRYEAEAWMASQVASGETLEVYGNNVYLPRLPVSAKVVRVDLRPVGQRSVLPGVMEVEAPYGLVEQRRSKWIVLSDGWVWQYLYDPGLVRPGYVISGDQQWRKGDVEARRYFQDLVSGRHPKYRTAFVASWSSRYWPRVEIHVSTAREIRIFEWVE